MSASLIGFLGQSKDADGQQLSWAQADIDGVPYRGPPSLYTPRSQMTDVAIVHDAKCRFFDMNVKEDVDAYLYVLNRAATQWFSIRKQVWFWQNTTKHYVEWFEGYAQHDPRRPRFPANYAEASEERNGHE